MPKIIKTSKEKKITKESGIFISSLIPCICRFFFPEKKKNIGPEIR